MDERPAPALVKDASVVLRLGEPIAMPVLVGTNRYPHEAPQLESASFHTNASNEHFKRSFDAFV
jgi:hypothetical protein